jgi:hypothetical protein
VRGSVPLFPLSAGELLAVAGATPLFADPGVLSLFDGEVPVAGVSPVGDVPVDGEVPVEGVAVVGVVPVVGVVVGVVGVVGVVVGVVGFCS